MIKNLNALRFVFIMLVVMSHVIGKSFDFGGECGVSFFFMLSGFILSYAYGGQVMAGVFQHGYFLSKQLAKFYPLHLLTFAIMLILDMRLGQFYDWGKLLANMLLLQSWVPSDDFYFVANGSSWFLSDMVFYYVVFPFVFRRLHAASFRRISVGGLMVAVGYVWLAQAIPANLINPLLYVSPILRLIDFVIGILVYKLYASDETAVVRMRLNRLAPFAVTLLEVALVIAVAISFFVYEHASLRFRCAALFWFVLPAVLFGFVLTNQLNGGVNRILHHPLMQWLGSISFEIYLTHYVTMRITYSLLSLFGVGEAERQLLLVIIPVVLVIIAVSYLTKCCYVNPVYRILIKRRNNDRQNH